MKKIIGILMVLLLYTFVAYTQNTVSYSYDANGNRLSRSILLKSTQQGQEQEKEIYSDNLGELEYKIFPNPTDGELKIQITNWQSDLKIDLSVFDMNSKLLIYQPVVSDESIVNLSTYLEGTYILQISEGSNNHTWKISKK